MANVVNTLTFTSAVIAPTAVANPCGLIAKWRFQGKYNHLDKFSMLDPTTAPVVISEVGIAHSVDKDYKFKLPTGAESKVYLDYTDEHVMVWY
jgi:hypothetical protein